jgi:putative glutamine amidotransferase
MRSIRDPATGELRDSISRDWTAYFDGLPVTAVCVPNDIENPRSLMTEIDPDALILTNGEDVGEYPPRDRTERSLLEVALEDDIPVLGVCRGHQFLNHYFGGDVVALADRLGQDHGHDGQRHETDIRDDVVECILPSRLEINSYHDFGVFPDGVASDLKTFATADDGVIEGLFHPQYRILSIQWHPERSLPNQTLIDDLVEAFLEGTLEW